MDSSELEALIARAVQEATKSLENSITNLKTEVSELREEIFAKDKRIDELETQYSELESKLDGLQQYGRRNNLRIFGVKESESENTDALVQAVAKSMGIELQPSAIDRSHRLGRQGRSNQPRPIIVKFVSYADRNRVFMAKRQLKGTEVTVREDLTQMRLQVLKSAVKAYTMKNVWTSDGVIKVNVGLKYPFSVRNMEDLDDLLLKHPSPGSK